MCRLNNAHDISLPTECNFQQFYNKLMPKKFSVRMLVDKNGPLVVCSMLIQQSNVVKRNKNIAKHYLTLCLQKKNRTAMLNMT